MNNALVSVIIPDNKNDGFLRDSIKTVLKQSFQDFEIIIVNYGIRSTKNPSFNFRDKRINYFWHEHIEINSARNFGITKAKGKYIALLNPGDVWEPEKLEKQVNILEKNPDIGLVYCGVRFIDENNLLLDEKPLCAYNGNVFNKLVMKNFIHSNSALIFRMSCLEKTGMFDESIYLKNDWEFYLRFALQYKFWAVKEYLVSSRVYKYNKPTDYIFFENSGFKVLNKIFQATDIDIYQLRFINTAYAMVYIDIGKKYFNDRHLKRARGYFNEAFKRDCLIFCKSDVLLFYILSLFSNKNIQFLRALKNNIQKIAS